MISILQVTPAIEPVRAFFNQDLDPNDFVKTYNVFAWALVDVGDAYRIVRKVEGLVQDNSHQLVTITELLQSQPHLSFDHYEYS
jgi:hypothetical protein